MTQQVLLVAHRVPVHLQAEDAQQEARVCVEAGKVAQDVQVEGGAKGAHLQVTLGSEKEEGKRRVSKKARGQDEARDQGQGPGPGPGTRTRARGGGALAWQTYGISPGLWLDFMWLKKTGSVSNAHSQIRHIAGGQTGTSRLDRT